MSRGIEAENLIADAVRENDFAGFANDKIVEEMLAGIGEGVAAKECAVGTEVNERGIAAIFGGVGPNGGVARVEADSENGQKMVAVGGNEIGSVTVRSDLHDLALRKTA